LEHGVRISGCTVFFVSDGLDDGPIIAQAATPVMPQDDEESLSNRILAQEHRIYTYAIRLYQEGKLQVRDRKVIIADLATAGERAVLLNPAPV
ncbi:MAG: phosphoribosylglycinamide formyltransferase, partial [Candidatus Binataceae bacterium]